METKTKVAVDALRITGTLTQLVRHVDERLRLLVDETLGITELGVLGTIDKGTELPSAVARLMRLDPGRVTRIVDGFERRGYIVRGIDREDRRRCPLSITSDGRRILNQGRGVVGSAMEAIISQLPGAQQDGLMNALDSIRTILDGAPAG